MSVATLTAVAQVGVGTAPMVGSVVLIGSEMNAAEHSTLVAVVGNVQLPK